MYKFFIQKILFLFDAEKVHHFTFLYLKFIHKLPFIATLIKSGTLQDKKLERKLKKLQQLIDKRKIKKARRFLKKLKKNYPDYDYTKFEKLLENN